MSLNQGRAFELCRAEQQLESHVLLRVNVSVGLKHVSYAFTFGAVAAPYTTLAAKPPTSVAPA